VILRDLAFIHLMIRERTKAIFAFAELHPSAVNSSIARQSNVISFSSVIKVPLQTQQDDRHAGFDLTKGSVVSLTDPSNIPDF
jgi:hypothetical protein